MADTRPVDDQQLQRFVDEGYLIIQGHVDLDVVGQLLDALERVERGLPAASGPATSGTG